MIKSDNFVDKHRLKLQLQAVGQDWQYRFGMIAYLATTHFDASRDLQETLSPYQKIYNYHVPQKNIGHITPIQALKGLAQKTTGIIQKET